jgi:hypothetical protein
MRLASGRGGEGAPYYEAAPGEWLDLGRGARLEVLGPPADPVEGGGDDLNDNSVVLRLTWGEVSFLLTGDLESAGEEALLREGGDLRSTILKVPHHGAADATSDPLLAAVQPEVAVISVGADHWFGHPSPAVLPGAWVTAGLPHGPERRHPAIDGRRAPVGGGGEGEWPGLPLPPAHGNAILPLPPDSPQPEQEAS